MLDALIKCRRNLLEQQESVAARVKAMEKEIAGLKEVLERLAGGIAVLDEEIEEDKRTQSGSNAS